MFNRIDRISNNVNMKSDRAFDWHPCGLTLSYPYQDNYI